MYRDLQQQPAVAPTFFARASTYFDLYQTRRDTWYDSTSRHAQTRLRRSLAFFGLGQHTFDRYPSLNAHRYEPMSKSARALVEGVFDEPNHALTSILGRVFSWLNRSGNDGSNVQAERDRSGAVG
jgi:hypothetical protein